MFFRNTGKIFQQKWPVHMTRPGWVWRTSCPWNVLGCPSVPQALTFTLTEAKAEPKWKHWKNAWGESGKWCGINELGIGEKENTEGRTGKKANLNILHSIKGDYIFRDEWYSLLMMMFIDFDSFVCLLNNKNFQTKGFLLGQFLVGCNSIFSAGSKNLIP